MTIEQLQALSDQELNALAAKLRGFKAFNFQAVKWLGVTDAQGKTHGKHKLRDWTPATSRDQSGKLLEWAAEQGAEFYVSIWKSHDKLAPSVTFDVRNNFFCQACDYEWQECKDYCGCSCHPRPDAGLLNNAIPGNDARAETIAFCAAMLAMEMQNRPAPKDWPIPS